MDFMLEEIKKMAREIVDKSPIPSFYREYGSLIDKSGKFFDENRLIVKIKDDVFETLENNFGHGFGHAKKVAIETGVIFVIEMSKNKDFKDIEYLLTIAQIAGLLHDICRKEKNHAKKGALYASNYLPLVLKNEKSIKSIVHAISNHEAFCNNATDSPSFEACVLSDSLYDSDKFRWGPDNFSHMIWAMLEYSDITAPQFLSGYKSGINSLHRIRDTFRSDTGKQYGPEFIDTGIEIGERLYRRINDKFDLKSC